MKIHTALTTQPGLGFFPAPVPTMVIFKIANDALQAALAGKITSSACEPSVPMAQAAGAMWRR
ncbi:MAG: hypothetical protein ORN51_00365 [Akkermansiaceae bacterium]|nr:hypothetical protein [Akkermansiaceae bacterium]